MPHKHGAKVGGIDSIEGIRLRCVCADGCWHFRSARGRQMPVGRRHVVWLHGRGPISLPRAVWELKTGKTMPAGWRAYRVCDSYDCANPDHIKAGTFEQYGRAVAKRGVFGCNAANARRAGEANSKLSAEMKLWAVESGQPVKEIAAALGVQKSIIYQLRRRLKLAPPSVFALGMAANMDQRRAA